MAGAVICARSERAPGADLLRELSEGMKSAGESNDEHLALFLEVSGEANGAYTYDMWFEDEGDAGPTDVLQRFGPLPVVISAASIARLRGATLEVGDAGLAIRNPNAPTPPFPPSWPRPP